MCHNPALDPVSSSPAPHCLPASLAPSSASSVVSLSSYASIMSSALAASSAARTLELECCSCLARGKDAALVWQLSCHSWVRAAPVLQLSCHTPLLGICLYMKHPQPHPNFLAWTWKWAKSATVWATWTHNWAKRSKSGQNFIRSGPIFYS